MMIKKIVKLILGCFLTVIFFSSCQKEKSEALQLRPVTNKTIFKNHTKGVDYSTSDLEVTGELIVEAGVEIEMQPGSRIHIAEGGKLTILGDKLNPVIINGKNNQRWKGIDLNHGDNLIRNAVINHASTKGKFKGSIATYGKATLILEETEISNTGESSAIVANESSVVQISSGCKIAHCITPFQRELSSEINLNAKVNMDEVQLACILVKSSNGSGFNLSSDKQLNKENLPYLFVESVFVKQHKFDINSGVKMLMYPGSTIHVEDKGTLSINGLANAPVSIECAFNDKDWLGVDIRNGLAHMRYATIKDVISKDSATGVVTVGNYGAANISRCVFQDNAADCAISIYPRAMVNPTIYTTNNLGRSGICMR